MTNKIILRELIKIFKPKGHLQMTSLQPEGVLKSFDNGVTLFMNAPNVLETRHYFPKSSAEPFEPVVSLCASKVISYQIEDIITLQNFGFYCKYLYSILAFYIR